MSHNYDLAEQTVTLDLFGPDALTEPAEIEAPEKYELLERLGQGGFGVVYKARDRSLDRLVALKFLTDARPADLERFRREARFAARLNIPSIVQVYEFAENDGQPCIAMQFIDGGSLADAKLEPEQIIRAIRAAAEALAHAHAAGIVHRDFKPANVLLDRAGNAYLTDFGIARDISNRGVTISQQGALMGTPALMPPEQARGDLHAIDGRSDIYALGASLYQLLCKRYPFERPHLVDVLHAVVHEEPPPPRAIRPDLPRALEAIILRCMQKDRARRYQSAAEFIAELDEFLHGRPVKSERAEWFRKLVGIEQPKPSSEPDLFQTVGIEIGREIAAWDANLYRVSKNITRLYPQLDSIIGRLDVVLADYPHFAWARFYRGMALCRRGRLDEALDEMERSIDRLADQAGAQFEMGRMYLTLHLREQRLAFRHMTREGVEHHLVESRGRLQQAEVCFEQTQRLKSDLLNWQIDYARAVSRLADRDYAGCVERCDAILADDADVEEVWKLRGDAQRLAGQAPFESYDRAIGVRRSFFEAHLAKADAYLERGMIGDARGALRDALDVFPDCAEALARLAQTALAEARADRRDAGPGERRQLVAEGLELIERAAALVPESYDVVVTLAELLTEKARLGAGIETLEEALARLDDARRLEGCQNRVNFLTASAYLERARLRRADGLNARDDLERVLQHECEIHGHHGDTTAWDGLIAAARAELESHSHPVA